jgi:hypothetical protein
LSKVNQKQDQLSTIVHRCGYTSRIPPRKSAKKFYIEPGSEDQPQGNACPDFAKTRHSEQFLGVCRRSAEKRKRWIAFCGVYAIFIKGTFQRFLRVNEFLHPPIWQDFWYCLFLYDQTNRRVTVDAENEVLKNYE